MTQVYSSIYLSLFLPCLVLEMACVSSRMQDQSDWLSEWLRVGLCPGGPGNAGECGCCAPGPQPELTPNSCASSGKSWKGACGASWTLEAGGGTWGCPCWLFELKKVLLAYSCGFLQTCEELLPKWRSLENSPEGRGEETFKEEINKKRWQTSHSTKRGFGLPVKLHPSSSPSLKFIKLVHCSQRLPTILRPLFWGPYWSCCVLALRVDDILT